VPKRSRAAIARPIDSWLTAQGIESGRNREVGYWSWQEAFDRPPEDPVALVMTFDNWSIKHLIDHEALNAWPQFVEFLGFGAHSWNHKTQILLPTEEGFAPGLPAK
jgi:hypothetical protein